MAEIRNVLALGLERLSTASPVWVAAALALYIASLFIVGARWRMFLRMLGADVPVMRATLSTLGGIAVGNLTPSSRIGGEACRIALARAGRDVSWPDATVATAWDRLSELPPIAALWVIAAFGIRDVSSRWRTGAIVVVATVAAVGAAIGLRRLRAPRAERGAWRQRLRFDRFDSRTFVAGVGWSGLLWLQDVLRLTCAALSLGVVLPPTHAAILAVLAMVGSIVPTVGGAGAVEGGLIGGLLAFGIDAPTAAAITAVERAISFGFSTAAGAAVVTLLGGRSLLSAVVLRRSAARRVLPRETPGTPAIQSRP